MEDWKNVLLKVAPTVAAALGGPLAGAAAASIGAMFGKSNATVEDISKVIEEGKLTAEQLSEIQRLEMQYKAEERERGFKYADLEFRDRDSARRANVEGGTQKPLFAMSVILLIVTLGTEIYVMINGLPQGVSEVVVGRVLGLMDAVALMVMGYHYGSSAGSAMKTGMLNSK